MKQIETCLIVEDHPEAQYWLANAVDQAFPNVSCEVATNIAEARARIEQAFDLVLLDIGLPDGSGLDLVGAFVEQGSEVVISSVYEDDKHLFDALKFGATGYLLKDHPIETTVQLLSRIIVEGQPPLSPKIAKRVLNFFSSHEQKSADDVASEEQLNTLTAREKDVLTLLAKGYTIPNIAELLNISGHTVGGYAKNVYRKLNVTSRAEATLEASRFGLV